MGRTGAEFKLPACFRARLCLPDHVLLSESLSFINLTPAMDKGSIASICG
jgi:hypothetical protein